MVANWQTVVIKAGSSGSENIDIPADQLDAPPGHVAKADGIKFHGNDRPKFHIEPNADNTGSRIVLEHEATEDLHFDVKRKGAD